jgi:outer membrane immunogenic protein
VKYSKLILSAAVAVFGFTTVASAADLPIKAPVAPIAAPSWTGWYIGLNAGGNWGRSETSTTVEDSTRPPAFFIPDGVTAINTIGLPTNFNTNGFIGGFQGGYNYQMGQWLAGVEADFEYFRSAGSNSVTGPLGTDSATITSSVRTNWLFTVRPRLGVVFNNWLFYGTGGLAVTNLRANWNFVVNSVANFVSESASASANRAGWTVGGGIETMLPGKWIIGAEYLYVNLGSVSAFSTNASAAGTPITNRFNHSADLTSNIVRVRLSKLF